jgi:hypothetical protein
MHGPRSRDATCPLIVLLLALAMPARANAQHSARRTLPPIELRIDAIDARSLDRGTLQVGAGVNLPLGYYVRFEIDGAGGVSRRDTVDHTSGRVDALARFLLDPFAESEWGLSIGGGMSALFASGARTHSYLVVVTDLEAPRIGVLIPALQLGLGGGVRVGVVIRGYQSGRR